MSQDLDEFCQEFAIRRSFSVPYAPPQNAQAERMWGILLKGVRICLAESKVPDKFWTQAMNHIAHLHNVLPSSSLPGEISPHEALYKTRPNVEKIRTWGCLAWYLLPDKDIKSKISPRSVAAIHLGLDDQRNGWVIYIPSLNRITTAYHLRFQENRFINFEESSDTWNVNVPTEPRPLRETEYMYQEDRDADTGENPNLANSDVRFRDIPNENIPPEERCTDPNCTLRRHPDSIPHSYEQLNTRRRSSRNQNPNYRVEHTFDMEIILDDVNGQAMTISDNMINGDITIPENYKEAIESRYGKRWKESMLKEITDLMKNDTWKEINMDDVPKVQRIEGSQRANGSILSNTIEMEQLRDSNRDLWYVDIHKFKAWITRISFQQH